jgi:hypothetical protein
MNKETNLTAEQVLYKQHMLEETKIEVESIKIDIAGYEKMIEIKLPERRARNNLLKKQDELRMKERNVRILEKQIRTKTESVIE